MTQESVETSIISYIPGKNENKGYGGHAMNSAIFEMFYGLPSIEIDFNLADHFDASLFGWDLDQFADYDVDVLRVDTYPLFDSWITSDGITEEYTQRSKMMAGDTPADGEFDTLDYDDYGPKLEERSDGTLKRFRSAFYTRRLEFDSPDGQTIDMSTVQPKKSETNPAQLDQYISATILENEDVNHLDESKLSGIDHDDGGYKPRHYDWVHHRDDPNADYDLINGKEAIRMGTIAGGYSTVDKAIMDATREETAKDVLFTLFGWDSNIPVSDIPEPVTSELYLIAEALKDFIAVVPIIHNWMEVTLMADGAFVIRMFDASPYPKHSMYVNGDQQGEMPLSYSTDDTDIDVQSGIFQLHGGAGRGPYRANPDEYEKRVKNQDQLAGLRERMLDSLGLIPKISDNVDFSALDEFYSSYPLWQYGVAADGTEFTDAEINDMMPKHGIFPISERSETSIDVSDMDTEKPADHTF